MNTSSSGEADRIKVVCRIRPAKNAAENSMRRFVNFQDTTTVVVNTFPEPKIFTFDYVADEVTSQEDMFQIVGLPYAQACIEGYNGTILCYGQTGTGKTFTMFGEQAADDTFEKSGDIRLNRGLVPRVLEHLWSHIDSYSKKLPDTLHATFTCNCSFFEIYQEKVYDLLDTNNNNASGECLLTNILSNKFSYINYLIPPPLSYISLLLYWLFYY